MRYQTLLAEAQEKPKRWLVTGGAGFIGSHLVEQLLSAGQVVVVLDNLSTGTLENLKEVLAPLSHEAQARFRFINGDICDIHQCEVSCEGVDYVLHHAGFVSVPLSLKDPCACHASNVTGFLNITLAALKCNVRRLIYASSSAIYGDDLLLPKQEAHPGKPISVYGASKRMNEIYADTFARNFPKLQFTGFRYFNIFGPRQDPSGGYAAVIPKWIMSMMRGIACVINGDGSTTRDFCPVQDVVQANILAALESSVLMHSNESFSPVHINREECSPTDASSALLIPRSDIYNVAGGQQTTLLQLHDMIARGVEKKNRKPIFIPRREGDILRSVADISMIKTRLGFEPCSDLAGSIKSTIDWYRSRGA
jgi:UDP-N-acetylglucosamine 4-epimerase